MKREVLGEAMEESMGMWYRGDCRREVWGWRVKEGIVEVWVAVRVEDL